MAPVPNPPHITSPRSTAVPPPPPSGGIAADGQKHSSLVITHPAGKLEYCNDAFINMRSLCSEHIILNITVMWIVVLQKPTASTPNVTWQAHYKFATHSNLVDHGVGWDGMRWDKAGYHLTYCR